MPFSATLNEVQPLPGFVRMLEQPVRTTVADQHRVRIDRRAGTPEAELEAVAGLRSAAGRRNKSDQSPTKPPVPEKEAESLDGCGKPIAAICAAAGKWFIQLIAAGRKCTGPDWNPPPQPSASWR